jgi:hypothetical protein
MKKRNRVTRIQDLAGLPVTPVKEYKSDETRQEFYAREEREARERAEAPHRKIVEENQAILSAELAKNNPKVAKFYGLPIAGIEDYIRMDMAPADFRGLPMTETRISNQEFDTKLTAFVENLPARGVTLSGDSARRFALYCYVQSEAGTILDDASLTEMLRRTIDLGIYGAGVAGRLTKPRATASQQPATESKPETFDDLANKLSTQSDAGNKALKSAAVDAALTGEVRATWAAFEESLYRNFNGFKLTRKQGELILKVMHERSLNMLKPSDYDQVRVSLARTGELPSHLIYPHEQLAIDMETADLSKPEVRREFNRRERQLRG